jgi:hypothetical protein
MKMFCEKDFRVKREAEVSDVVTPRDSGVLKLR